MRRENFHVFCLLRFFATLKHGKAEVRPGVDSISTDKWNQLPGSVLVSEVFVTSFILRCSSAAGL